MYDRAEAREPIWLRVVSRCATEGLMRSCAGAHDGRRTGHRHRGWAQAAPIALPLLMYRTSIDGLQSQDRGSSIRLGRLSCDAINPHFQHHVFVTTYQAL